jgi:ribosomal protein S18 acetylase RimI-like enzyme
MAALTEPVADVRVVELRELRSPDLAALLEEEIRAWRESFDWNFKTSADLVRRYVDLRSLQGFALLEGREVAGYSYYVMEEQKGVVGDLYVRRRSQSVARETQLLDATVSAMLASPALRRIESQLMMVGIDGSGPVVRPEALSSFDRLFMIMDLSQLASLPSRQVRRGIFFEPWEERFQEATAQLIEAAYRGHVDGQINDQYRTVSGARRFLYNIVQYPGCGTFFRPASIIAFDFHSEGACGVCLASIVSPEVGHITQICNSPEVRGGGVGYELLLRSLRILRQHGCRRVSLTVTASNTKAVELYQRVGFRTVRQFAACIWEGFR